MTRDILWIVIGILLGLICYFADGSVVLAQQPSQTRCYMAGPTQVCETKDRTTGAVIGTSRCYQTGSGQTCDTQSYGSSSSSSTTIPVPNLNPPRR